MAKYGSSSWSVLLVDGFNLLSAKLKGVTYKIEAKQEDSTGMGDAWEEHLPSGQKVATFSQDGAFFDSDTDGIHDAMEGQQATARVLVCAPFGNTLGAKFIGARGLYGQAYEVLGQVGGLTKANVTYTVSGRLDANGEIVQPLATKTADWNTKTLGTPVDSGASSANGAVGYLAVSACTGFTNFVGKLRDSADNVTYADLVTFTDNVAAPFAEAVEVAGTVDRYLSFDGNVTGTGSITVFAGLARL